MRREAGFTLMELMIVIAMFGFVASICGAMAGALHRTDQHTAAYVDDVSDLRRAVRAVERDLRSATSLDELDYRLEDDRLLRNGHELARRIGCFEMTEAGGLATVRMGLAPRREVASRKAPVVVLKVRLRGGGS
jgi:type II secretion system protein J